MQFKLLKHLTRLITILIFFVLLFLLSICVYSVGYWGDIYRYLHANITIRRISTISELNLTILNVDYVVDYVVDNDTTTETNYDYGYGDENEFGDFDINDADDSSNFTHHRMMKRANSDYSLLNRTVVIDYFLDYDEESVAKDLLREREFRRRNAEGDVNIPIQNHTELRICDGNEFSGNVEDAIFSWTAAIFLKESNRTDFVYACDGVTLSQRHVVAVKKCFNYTTSKEDILLVVGKRSLRNIGEREAAYKVERMVFQNGTERNDLVLLETGTDIDFNRYVQAACISSPGSIAPVNYEQAIAIGYNTTNDLSILDLTVDSPSECLNEKSDTSNGTTKLVYCMRVQGGNATCPNLGSVFASKSTIPSKIKLLAILTDTSDDCHTKLSFTSLLENLRWLEENVTS